MMKVEKRLRDLLDFPHHHQQLIEESAIDPRVVLEREYRTVTTKAELGHLGFSKSQQLVPALLIPMYSPRGELATYQIKADCPRQDKDGKPIKYETPAGSPVRLDVHPSQVERLKDPKVPLWITEGVKKGDCLVSRGQCAVVLQGVWCWQREGIPLPEWEDIRLHGRQVMVAFDSDVVTNPKVQAALDGLVSYLKVSRGARVKVLYLPGEVNGTKQGVDDYLASSGTVEGLARYLEDEMRNHLREVGISLADVKPQRVGWLWKGRIPLGKLTVIDGDPGTGKSAFVTDLVARISAGRAMPDGSQVEASGAVLLNAEDGLRDTIRPRLAAAGADLSRVLALATVPDRDGTERLLSLPKDIPVLRRGVEQVRARFVVVDPLMAFLSGNVDAHRDQDIRRALAPLARLAEETGAAVVVIRHLNKTPGGNPLYRGGASIGIVGAARSALLVAKHPEDPKRRVLAGVKSNLAGAPLSLAFVLREAANGAVRVEWKGETPLDAAALLAAPTDEEERRELIALRDVVVGLLEDSGGSWEGEPTELFNVLAGIDLAVVPDRPDELTKLLQKLARVGTSVSLSRGRRRDREEVVRSLRLELR
jgi:hypothetical protein